MRLPYKPFPVKGDPGFPGLDTHWVPTLNVSLIFQHCRGNRFEAIVDSGSPWCLFHADVGEAVGIKIRKGKSRELGGVLAGASGTVYFHSIKIALMDSIFGAKAGFSYELAVAGILGRSGFFDNRIVTFDPSQTSPGELEIQQFHRI